MFRVDFCTRRYAGAAAIESGERVVLVGFVKATARGKVRARRSSATADGQLVASAAIVTLHGPVGL